MESEGLVVHPDESFPKDPYIVKRGKLYEMRSYKTPSDFDKLRQFLEMDRKVLRFYLLWDDRDSMFGELRKFVLHVSIVMLNKLHIANNFPKLGPKGTWHTCNSNRLFSLDVSCIPRSCFKSCAILHGP